MVEEEEGLIEGEEEEEEAIAGQKCKADPTCKKTGRKLLV